MMSLYPVGCLLHLFKHVASSLIDMDVEYVLYISHTSLSLALACFKMLYL